MTQYDKNRMFVIKMRGLFPKDTKYMSNAVLISTYIDTWVYKEFQLVLDIRDVTRFPRKLKKLIRRYTTG